MSEFDKSDFREVISIISVIGEIGFLVKNLLKKRFLQIEF